MDVFELIKEVSTMGIKEAFEEIKSKDEFFQYDKFEAPYFLQPEGMIYTLYEHDFSFKCGNVITYTAKEGDPAADNGTWDCFIDEEDNWYRWQDSKFVLHDTSRDQRPGRPGMNMNI